MNSWQWTRLVQLGAYCVYGTLLFSLYLFAAVTKVLYYYQVHSHNFECVILNVYAPHDVSCRATFWHSICNLKSELPKPWCLGGDFNEIKNVDKRKGCSRKDREMRDFDNFMSKLEVSDLPMLDRQFTWSNSQDGARWSRLDRFMFNPEWLVKFKFKLWGLPRVISDHCPLLLLDDEVDWGPRPFKFINAWTLHPLFLPFVKKIWVEVEAHGWAGFVLWKKLKTLKEVIRKWNVEVYGNLTLNIKKDEKELHVLDLAAETRILDDSEVNRKRDVRDELWKLSKRNEWLWLQKSRLTWALKGDHNTKFFHLMASSRQNRNLLSSVSVDGIVHENPQRLKSEVFTHFNRLFSNEWKIRPKLGGPFQQIDSEQSSRVLEAKFSTIEV